MKRILVAVDLSETSTLAVARAVEIARAMGTKVILLHVVSIPSAPAILPPPQLASIRGAAERSLERFLADIPPDLRDGILVEFGDPVAVICRCARKLDAAMVVLGAHRYGRLQKALGTNAARIVNEIDRPALVVRPAPAVVPAAAVKDGRMKAGEILRTDHPRLEHNYAKLLAAYEHGDWDEVRKRWDLCESTLLAHLDTEERKVFPEFRAVDAEETACFEGDHARLRKLLSSLGVRMDLHSVSQANAAELVARLRAHAAREERLYAWMDRTMPVEEVRPPTTT